MIEFIKNSRFESKGRGKMGTEQLVTDRLILRKLTVDDSRQMFNNWASDPAATKYLPWKPYQKLEYVSAYLKTIEHEYQTHDTFCWGIELKGSRQLIGSISVVDDYKEIQTMAIGYVIGQNWWHQGYTSEALSAIIDFLFETTSVNRLEAFHDAENKNSGSVLTKCGFVFEGVLRQRGKNNRGVVDQCIYSLLRQ
ncbi:GNAT family N-acetyltransferase [Enterococcus malodoratus]|uniref:GNAT family N-acetyltransferase n=1 Tax=Enterococcus malodoratus TaxID=71451 RepID=UPI0030B8AAD6